MYKIIYCLSKSHKGARLFIRLKEKTFNIPWKIRIFFQDVFFYIVWRRLTYWQYLLPNPSNFFGIIIDVKIKSSYKRKKINLKTIMKIILFLQIKKKNLKASKLRASVQCKFIISINPACACVCIHVCETLTVRLECFC